MVDEGYSQIPTGGATSEDHSRSAIDSSNEAYVGMDPGGFVTDWNPQAERTFGWTREEALGRVLADTIIPPEYRDKHWGGLQRFLKTGEGPVLDQRLQLTALHRDGYEFPVELTISARQVDGRWAFHAFLHDISQRHREDQLMRALHAVTAALAQATDVDGVLHEVLMGLAQATDWQFAAYWQPDGELLRCVESWHDPGLDAGPFADRSVALELRRGEGVPGRVWATGEPVWIADLTTDSRFVRAEEARAVGLRSGLCLPLPSADGVRGTLEFLSVAPKRRQPELEDMMRNLSLQVGGFLDVLEQRASLVTKLERLATTDELTSVANRRGWEEGLTREMGRSKREGTDLWVALLDLDHFKAFNDGHGHQAGDAMLAETAAAWRNCLRVTDVLARYGGEEFALAFSSHPPETALMVIERLRAAVPEGLTCSAGMALWNGKETALQVVARADRALYEAKDAGRDQAVAADS